MILVILPPNTQNSAQNLIVRADDKNRWSMSSSALSHREEEEEEKKKDCTKYILIAYFTIMCSVTWPSGRSEAEGDLVLIQTALLFSCKSSFSYAN